MFTKTECQDIVRNATSKSDICRKFGFPINGSGIRKANEIIELSELDTSHFLSGGQFNRKYPLATKICPVCGKEFEASIGSPKEQRVCSRSCANTFFRSGKHHWKYNHGGYVNNGKDPEHRAICFKTYDKRCIICGWTTIVHVHHIDENSNNNNSNNLVPLCPNHHAMMHLTQYKGIMLKQIKNKGR
jgi:hypothetical protein